MTRPQRPPMKRAAAAGVLLELLLQQKGMAGKLNAYRSWLVWNEVVGPQIAAHAQPARIRDGVLEVRVDQAVWMQQLQLMKPKILARLNERLGGELITDIFWRRGQKVDKPEPPIQPPQPVIDLTADERRHIEDLVSAIGDPEARDALYRIFCQQLRISKCRPKNES